MIDCPNLNNYTFRIPVQIRHALIKSFALLLEVNMHRVGLLTLTLNPYFHLARPSKGPWSHGPAPLVLLEQAKKDVVDSENSGNKDRV